MSNKVSEINKQVRNTDLLGKYLTFFIDTQIFGISISNVVQIVGMQQITDVPEMPHYVKGIINLRGEIIPVIDMRLRLGKDEAEYTEKTCIIVNKINDKYVGIIVDQVDAVLDINDKQIAAAPNINNSDNAYVTGVAKLEDKIALLMDTMRILGTDELKLITEKI